MDKKTKIYNAAKKLFVAQGFKKTKVPQITKRAGVAVGTFYNYYDSKDWLFMQIYLDENNQLKEEIKNDLNMDQTPIDIIKELMKKNYEGMINNPILREWYNPDVYRKVEKMFRENYEKGIPAHKESTLVIIKQWQKEGKIRRDIDSDMVYGIIYSIMNIDMHKEEIGVEYFPKIMDYLFEFIMSGLE
ncbi:MAG: HTH-type transcriptional repressor Bm3R1 [Candidatus Izimaplasma bacterium HR2]|nr:MAG: HTH-type transcriptional repressor Bm3R1 [Candidatus Izimaplasma bacterium HR2]